MYAELNTKSDYCQECGYDGEIKVVEDSIEQIQLDFSTSEKSSKWTDKEIEYLKENYAMMGSKCFSNITTHSKSACYKMANRLGLKKYKK